MKAEQIGKTWVNPWEIDMSNLEDRAKKFLDLQTYGTLIPQTRVMWTAWLVGFVEKETAGLQAKNERLQKGLEHYADPSNWQLGRGEIFGRKRLYEGDDERGKDDGSAFAQRILAGKE